MMHLRVGVLSSKYGSVKLLSLEDLKGWEDLICKSIEGGDGNIVY